MELEKTVEKITGQTVTSTTTGGNYSHKLMSGPLEVFVFDEAVVVEYDENLNHYCDAHRQRIKEILNETGVRKIESCVGFYPNHPIKYRQVFGLVADPDDPSLPEQMQAVYRAGTMFRK